MAPAKKKTTPARKAAKKPVLNLKATEVKSAAEKSEKPTTAAMKSADSAKSATGTKTSTSGKTEKPVEAKKPAEKKQQPETQPTNTPGKKPTPSGKKKPGKGALVLVSLAALVAAGLGGAWAFKTYGARYFADPNAISTEKFNAALSRIEKLEAGLGNSASGSDIKTATDALRKQLDANSSSLTANQKTIVENRKKLAELEKTAGEIRVALAKAAEENTGPVAIANQLQFKDLSAKISGLEKSLGDVKKTTTDQTGKELAALKTRFDALLIRLSAAEEQASAASKSASLVKEAQEKLAKSPASNPASELARSFTILRAQVSQGEPYEQALNDVAGKIPDATALDALRPFATTGVPTLATLKTALSEISFAKVNAAQPADDASSSSSDSVVSRLTSSFSGLVKVTRAGEADWDALKEKALKALDAGELAGAVAALSGGEKTPDSVRNWLELAGQRTTANTAIKNLSAAIVARLKTAQ